MASVARMIASKRSNRRRTASTTIQARRPKTAMAASQVGNPVAASTAVRTTRKAPHGMSRSLLGFSSGFGLMSSR